MPTCTCSLSSTKGVSDCGCFNNSILNEFIWGLSHYLHHKVDDKSSIMEIKNMRS